MECCESAAEQKECVALCMSRAPTCLMHHHIRTSSVVPCSLQGASGPLRGTTAEADAELEALRNERALLIDKLNNHPDVRKYAGEQSIGLACSNLLCRLSIEAIVTSAPIKIIHCSSATVRSSWLH